MTKDETKGRDSMLERLAGILRRRREEEEEYEERDSEATPEGMGETSPLRKHYKKKTHP